MLIIVASVGYSLARFHQNGLVDVVTTPTTSPVASGTTKLSTSISAPRLTGTLILDDPMSDNSKGYQWDQGDLNGGLGLCGGFTNNVYHVTIRIPGVVSCSPEAKVPLLKNLTFQVQMSVIGGDEGGISFRGNSALSQFYYFAVGTDGSYHLDIDNRASNLDMPQILLEGTNAAIKKGLNQPNGLAVVASGSSISLYVNYSLIDKVNDSTYSQGQIGVAAGDRFDQTEVVFSNAKVWKR